MLVTANSRISIAEALGEREFWECEVAESHQPFQSCKAIRQHFTQADTSSTREGWETQMPSLQQRWLIEESESEVEEQNKTQTLTQKPEGSAEGEEKEA
jgi:hypothetical protein